MGKKISKIKTLIEIISEFNLFNGDHKSGTDKEYIHKYISNFYQECFEKIQSKDITLLEIGTCTGASLKLWKEFFVNGQIEGIDIIDTGISKYIDDKIVYHHFDAYDPNLVNTLNDYDIIIDDGPHDLNSQLQFIKLYYNKVKQGGYMIIEDVNNDDDIITISEELKKISNKTPIILDHRLQTGYSNEIIIYVKK